MCDGVSLLQQGANITLEAQKLSAVFVIKCVLTVCGHESLGIYIYIYIVACDVC